MVSQNQLPPFEAVQKRLGGVVFLFEGQCQALYYSRKKRKHQRSVERFLSEYEALMLALGIPKVCVPAINVLGKERHLKHGQLLQLVALEALEKLYPEVSRNEVKRSLTANPHDLRCLWPESETQSSTWYDPNSQYQKYGLRICPAFYVSSVNTRYPHLVFGYRIAVGEREFFDWHSGSERDALKAVWAKLHPKRAERARNRANLAWLQAAQEQGVMFTWKTALKEMGWCESGVTRWLRQKGLLNLAWEKEGLHPQDLAAHVADSYIKSLLEKQRA